MLNTGFSFVTLNPLARWLGAPSIATALAVLLSACGGGVGSGSEATIDTARATSASANADSSVPQAPSAAAIDPAADARSASAVTAVSVASAVAPAESSPVDENTLAAASLSSTAPDLASETTSAAGEQPVLGTYTPTYTGRGYYVNSLTGSDSYPGSVTQPWRTLARAAQAQLNTGDALLLACGSKWRETVEFGSAFAPSGNVLIGAYGSCDDTRWPEITGAKMAASWTFSSSTATGDIFVANVDGQIASVFRGGDLFLRARHPNYGGVAGEFGLSRTGTTRTGVVLSAADQTFVGNKDLLGATVIVRSAPYSVEQRTASAYAPSTAAVSLSSATNATPVAGAGYYLEGKSWMLDAHHEWLHDEATSKLYFFKGRSAPINTAAIEHTRPVTTLTVRGIPNVRIEHVRVSNSGEDGLRVIESGQAIIKGVQVLNSRVNGIHVYSTSGHPWAQGVSIESSYVANAGVTGIGVSVTSAVVVGNTVTDVGTTPGLAPVASVRLSEANSSARGNTILRSGFKGLVFANRSGVTISGNTIREACLRLTDCGAIYGWGANSSGSRAAVTQNHITAVSAPNTNGAAGGAPELVAAIYLDEGASNIDVTSNYISDVRIGVNLHKASYNTVANNIVFAAQDGAIRVQSSGTDTQSVKRNNITGNRFFMPNFFRVGSDGVPKKIGGVGQIWVHQNSAASMFSGVNANTASQNVAIHLGDASALRWRLQSGLNYVDYESSGWAGFAPTDTATRPYRARMATVQGTSLIANSTMESVVTPWTTYSYERGANIVNFGFQTNCQGSCALFSPATTNDVLMQTSLRQTPTSSNLMYVHYRAIGGPVATTSRLEVREDVAPYNPAYMEPSISLPANAERQQEVFFNRTTSADLRLTIKGSVAATVLFDDVELYQVTSFQLLSPLSTGRLLVNIGTSDQNYTCAQLELTSCNVVDQAGVALTWPIQVRAQSAAPIFIKSSVWVVQ